MSIVIIDNGEDYSNHDISFVEAGDISTQEVLRVVGGRNVYLAPRRFVLGRADRIEWRESGGSDDVVSYVGEATLLHEISPWVHERGKAGVPPVYGEVLDDKAQSHSRALLERCVALWPTLPLWDGCSKADRERIAAERATLCAKVQAWLDAHPEHVDAVVDE